MTNTLYKDLLDTFADNTGNWLFMKLGDIGDDWGRTKGSWLNSNINTGIPDTYEITIKYLD